MSSPSPCYNCHGEQSYSSINWPATLAFADALNCATTLGLRDFRRIILSSSSLSLAFGQRTYLYSCFVYGWSTVLKSLASLSSLAFAISSSVRLRKYFEPTLRIFSARPSSTLISDFDFLCTDGNSWPIGSRLMVFFLQSGRLLFLVCWWNLWSMSSLQQLTIPFSWQRSVSLDSKMVSSSLFWEKGLLSMSSSLLCSILANEMRLCLSIFLQLSGHK